MLVLQQPTECRGTGCGATGTHQPCVQHCVPSTQLCAPLSCCRQHRSQSSWASIGTTLTNWEQGRWTTCDCSYRNGVTGGKTLERQRKRSQTRDVLRKLGKLLCFSLMAHLAGSISVCIVISAALETVWMGCLFYTQSLWLPFCAVSALQTSQPKQTCKTTFGSFSVVFCVQLSFAS